MVKINTTSKKLISFFVILISSLIITQYLSNKYSNIILPLLWYVFCILPLFVFRYYILKSANAKFDFLILIYFLICVLLFVIQALSHTISLSIIKVLLYTFPVLILIELFIIVIYIKFPLKFKIYISSTFQDLEEYRKKLIEIFQKQASNKFKLTKIMELMYDNGTHSRFTDDCIAAVKKCDIYFMILGNKIGSFPPNESRTYTEIEYDTAVRHNKELYLFKLKDVKEEELDNKEKYNEILGKFKGKPINEFKDTHEFDIVIRNAIIAISNNRANL